MNNRKRKATESMEHRTKKAAPQGTICQLESIMEDTKKLSSRIEDWQLRVHKMEEELSKMQKNHSEMEEKHKKMEDTHEKMEMELIEMKTKLNEIELEDAKKLQVTRIDQQAEWVDKQADRIDKQADRVMDQQKEIEKKKETIVECNCAIDSLKNDLSGKTKELNELRKYRPAHVSGSPSITTRNSAEAQEVMTENFVAQELYYDDFALKLYERKCSNTPITEKAREFGRLLVSLKSLSSLSSVYLDGIHSLQETTYTAIVARLFDRFVVPDSKVSQCAVYHQVQARGARADLLFFKLKNGVPDIPLLVSDLKKVDGDFQSSVTQTHLYAAIVNEACYSKNFGSIFLGLAGTPQYYCLYLYRPCNRHLHHIEVCKFLTDEDYAKLFEVVEYGISELSNNILIRGPSCKISSCCDGDHRHLAENVLHCLRSNFVYKYYSTETKAFDIMSKLNGYINGLHLKKEYLTDDHRYMRIKSRYIDQDGATCSDAQEDMLKKTLKELHGQGYVHSDIRRANILFDVGTDYAYLIDFDLCDEAGTLYPCNFNHTHIDERHKDAVANNRRHKDHDNYSLQTVCEKLKQPTS